MRRRLSSLLCLFLCVVPRVAFADTGTSSETGGDEAATGATGQSESGTDGWFHESTQGLPLFEGPAVNDPPIRITLDDDGLCSVGEPGAGWLVVVAIALGALVRRRPR